MMYMTAAALQPLGRIEPLTWLLVILPVAGAAAFFLRLLVTGDAAGRSGLIAPLARLDSSLRRVSDGLPAWAIGPMWLQMWALSFVGVGLYWDIAWHIDLGRDRTLFTPPHTMILLALGAILISGLFSIAFATLERAEVGMRLGRLRVPYGALVLVLCGVGAVIGFPLDDLWHRTYGIDVTLWSPTHLLMVGGGVFSCVGSWMLYAETGRHEGRNGIRRALAANTLLAFTVVQLEYDFGVPQWQALMQPILMMMATGLAIVAARAAFGRGWGLIVALNFVVSRSVIILLVGGLLHHTAPRFPLYLGIALVVELAFALGDRRNLSSLSLAVLCGAGIGTVGLASEWGWSHLFGREPWQLVMFPGIWIAVAMAFAASIAGLAMGRTLGRLPVSMPAAAVALAVLAIPALLALGLPRNTEDVTARMTVVPQGEARQAVDRDGFPAVEQDVMVDLQVSPAEAVASTDIFRITSWQGGSTRNVALVGRGEGHYHAPATVPTGASWKTIVVLMRRDVFMVSPVFMPEDREYNLDEIRIQGTRDVTFVAGDKMLLREAHDGAPAVRLLAYAGFFLVVAIWVGAIILGLVRINGGAGGSGSARASVKRRRPAVVPAAG